MELHRHSAPLSQRYKFSSNPLTDVSLTRSRRTARIQEPHPRCIGPSAWRLIHSRGIGPLAMGCFDV